MGRNANERLLFHSLSSAGAELRQYFRERAGICVDDFVEQLTFVGKASCANVGRRAGKEYSANREDCWNSVWNPSGWIDVINHGPVWE